MDNAIVMMGVAFATQMPQGKRHMTMSVSVGVVRHLDALLMMVRRFWGWPMAAAGASHCRSPDNKPGQGNAGQEYFHCALPRSFHAPWLRFISGFGRNSQSGDSNEGGWRWIEVLSTRFALRNSVSHRSRSWSNRRAASPSVPQSRRLRTCCRSTWIVCSLSPVLDAISNGCTPSQYSPITSDGSFPSFGSLCTNLAPVEVLQSHQTSTTIDCCVPIITDEP